MAPEGLFNEVEVVNRENAVLLPALSNQVCPPKLLFAMSPWFEIEPLAGLAMTANICEREVLL
jgi:hypothetical protein